MKLFERILALLCTFALLFATIPLQVVQAETTDNENTEKPCSGLRGIRHDACQRENRGRAIKEKCAGLTGAEKSACVRSVPHKNGSTRSRSSKRCTEIERGTDEYRLCTRTQKRRGPNRLSKAKQEVKRGRRIRTGTLEECANLQKESAERRECMSRAKTNVRERVRSVQKEDKMRERMRKRTRGKARLSGASRRSVRRTYKHGDDVRDAIKACYKGPKDEVRACLQDARK